ncbi:MAG: hypothetical protein IKS99_00820, partial [Firmicutes bacterium]|nr:hypothetical protein [Bacillota bacterium]
QTSVAYAEGDSWFSVHIVDADTNKTVSSDTVIGGYVMYYDGCEWPYQEKTESTNNAVNDGVPVTIFATENMGYEFAGWYQGYEDEDGIHYDKDKLITSDETYEFTAPLKFSPAMLCAVFKKDLCTDGNEHNYVETIEKATFGKAGEIYIECSKCHKRQGGMVPLVKIDSAKLKTTSYTYNGKAKKPGVVVMTCDGPMDTDQYKVEYSNNINAGTATAKVTMTSKWYKGTKTLTFKINKAKNSIEVKGLTGTVKYSKTKARTLKVSSVLKYTKKPKGTITYTKTSGKKEITIAGKNGKVTVKKGLKKGTYTVKVKITAKSKNYKTVTKTVSFKVKVK